MPHLLSISIGPVQDFIVAARRSRDLWFGSWLLSELSKAAALAIVERTGNDLNSLIFPAPHDVSELKTLIVANKIVARIEPESWQGYQDMPEVGRQIKEAIDMRLKAVREDAFSFHRIPGPFDSGIADLQIDDLVEYAWAAMPYGDGGRSYKDARDMTERLLAARKATRNFARVRWGANVPKSSLDGQRESVIDERAYDRVTRDGRREYRRSDYEFRRDYGVRPGERLCGVGLLKRHGQRGNDNRITSTSHVAAQPLLDRLQPSHQAYLTDYIKTLATCIDLTEHNRVPINHPIFARYDGHLLFKERLKEFVPQDKLQIAQQALFDFFAQTRLPAPQPYYALLFADGDRMGKAIDQQETPEQHRDLSRLLAEFSGDVSEIVRDYRGSLIYSGGDDVLAFVPLHKVLQCAARLAQRFRSKLGKFTVEENGEASSPTLSVGIAVAHHLEPLSDALELARQAEKKAKGIPGKDALAVIVDKRSGVSRAVAGKWGALDVRLQQFIEWHGADKIPDGAAYHLRDLALRLGSTEATSDNEKKALEAAKRHEAIRILRRKRAAHGQEEMGAAVKDLLEGLLEKDDAGQQPVSVAQLADELIVAKIFADAKQLSQPEEARQH